MNEQLAAFVMAANLVTTPTTEPIQNISIGGLPHTHRE